MKFLLCLIFVAFACANAVFLGLKKEKELDKQLDIGDSLSVDLYKTNEDSLKVSIEELVDGWKEEFQGILNQIKALSFQKSSHKKFCQEFCSDFYKWCKDLCVKLTSDKSIGFHNYLEYYPCTGSCVIHSVSCCVSP